MTGPTVRIAVVDPLPMFVRGLTTTLVEAGHPVEAPDDVLAWVRRPGVAMALLTVTGESDWRLVADLALARPDAVLIVLLPEVTVNAGGWLRAVSAGAVGVMPREATAATVREVVQAALQGRSLLPVEVLRAVVAGQHSGLAGPNAGARPLSDGELDWLRQLSDGSTVDQLAQRAGYSERMMFRLLAKVYRRLGVANRTTAILRARDEGWL